MLLRLVSVKQNVLTADSIDAFDATPVIDLRPFILPDAPGKELKVPDWTGRTMRSELSWPKCPRVDDFGVVTA